MAQKGELHIRNKHNGQYDFPLLIENYPPLKRFVSLNPLGVQTINFFNPQAVKALNKALSDFSPFCHGIKNKITSKMKAQRTGPKICHSLRLLLIS